jgi:hypothetical protein
MSADTLQAGAFYLSEASAAHAFQADMAVPTAAYNVAVCNPAASDPIRVYITRSQSFGAFTGATGMLAEPAEPPAGAAGIEVSPAPLVCYEQLHAPSSEEQPEQLLWQGMQLHHEEKAPQQWEGVLPDHVQHMQLQQLLQEEQQLQQQLVRSTSHLQAAVSDCAPLPATLDAATPRYSLFNADMAQQVVQTPAENLSCSFGNMSVFDRSCNSSFTSQTANLRPTLDSIWQSISMGGSAGITSENSCITSDIGRGISNNSSIWSAPNSGRTVSNSSSISSVPSLARGVSGSGVVAGERLECASGLQGVFTEQFNTRTLEARSNGASGSVSGGWLAYSR